MPRRNDNAVIAKTVRVIVFFTAMTAGCGGIIASHAQEIYPNDDTYTHSRETGSVHDDEGVFVKGDYRRDGWVEFTFGPTTVAAADLRMYQTLTSCDAQTIEIRGIEFNFDENTLTWNNQPNADTWTYLGGWDAPTGARWYQLGITAFYNSNLGKTVSIRLRTVWQGSDYTGQIYEDRENSQGSGNRPYIRLTPVGGPSIQEVSPDPDPIGPNKEYVRQMMLTQGTAPITWSVVQGPAGLTINNSGYVSGWTPVIADVGNIYMVEIQASNAYGIDSENWRVQVTVDPSPLPISANDDTYTHSRETGTAHDNDGIWVKADYRRHGWVEFTFGSVAVGAAKLWLYQTVGNNDIHTIELRGSAYNFNESTLTWNDQPNADGWPYLGVWHVPTGARWYELDITSFYNTHLGSTISMRLYTAWMSDDRYCPIFEDRENTRGSGRRPYIELAAVPTAVAPQIAEVLPDPDTVPSNTEYTKQLMLVSGTPPVTWSLLQGPTGVTVDQSGYVGGWTPGDSDVGSSFTVEVQAGNVAGNDQESWNVTVVDATDPVARCKDITVPLSVAAPASVVVTPVRVDGGHAKAFFAQACFRFSCGGKVGQHHLHGA